MNNSKQALLINLLRWYFFVIQQVLSPCSQDNAKASLQKSSIFRPGFHKAVGPLPQQQGQCDLNVGWFRSLPKSVGVMVVRA